jgi:hypothetical protein
MGSIPEAGQIGASLLWHQIPLRFGAKIAPSAWSVFERPRIMRIEGFLSLGAALILVIAASAYTGHRLTEQQLDWIWELRAPNGHPGFALVFNLPAWTWASGRAPSDSNHRRRTDRLTTVIEHGLRQTLDGCLTAGHRETRQAHRQGEETIDAFQVIRLCRF